MNQTCRWFQFTSSYTGERCDNVSTTTIFADGGSAPICAAHKAQWDEHLIKWNKQQKEFRQQDQNSNYLQWGAGIFATLLVFVTVGPVIGLLGLIASGVIYSALRS